MAKPRYPLAKKLAKLQDLVGRALADYQNDRSPSRAEKVQSALTEAFDIFLESIYEEEQRVNKSRAKAIEAGKKKVPVKK